MAERGLQPSEDGGQNSIPSNAPSIQNGGETQPILGRKPRSMLNWKWIIPILVVLSPLIIIGLFLVSFPSSVESPEPTQTLLYENTIAVVEDFPTFHVNKVSIYQNPEQPDAVHILKILMAKKSCDNLPHKNVPINNQFLFPPPNKTLYLLKGSELRYNICAASNESQRSKAFMDFYIVSGLEEIKEKKRPQHYAYHHAIYLGYSKSLPNDTKPIYHHWKCYSIRYTVNKNGYYTTLLFFPLNIPHEDVKVWHETNNSYKIIEEHSLPDYCPDSDTHEKEETCDITIEGSMHALIDQRQCVVVDVRTKVDLMDTFNFTQVIVEFSYRNSVQTLFYTLGAIFLVIILFPIPLCLALKGMRKCCRKRRQIVAVEINN